MPESRPDFWVAGDYRALGEEPASLSGGGLSTWFDCVGDSCDFSSHLDEDVWCIVRFSAPSAPATSLLWRWSFTLFRELLTTTPDFPVDHLLPRRATCLARCGAPARLEEGPSPSQCYIDSIESCQRGISVSCLYFFIFFPSLYVLACLELHP